MLDSTVVFNEIMYNPAGDTDDTLEWVELHNQMSKPMDISNWSIEGGINYTFPEGTAVTGDDYVVIAIHPSSLGIADVLGPYTGNLANDGEELRLVSNNSRVMNVVDYGDNDPWPVGPDGSGMSLAKINRNGASAPADNWSVSHQLGGTPGAHNFPTDTNDDVPVIPFQSIVSPGTQSRVLIPAQASDLNFQSIDWKSPSFNDDHAPGWFDRTLGVGFDTTGAASVGPAINTAGDIQAQMSDINASALVRSEFEISNPHGFEEMQLSISHNDGFVAFLNGSEIARNNAPPGTPAYNATAEIGDPTGKPTTIIYDATTQLSGTHFNSHFLDSAFFDNAWANPGPYGTINNLSDQGWIWLPGAFFDVDFGQSTPITGFRAYSTYAGGSRGATFVVEHSDDGTTFSRTDGGSFAYTTQPGVGVNDEGQPETTGGGFGGWYQFDFNARSASHRYWRLRHDGILVNGHAPRTSEIQFLGPWTSGIAVTEVTGHLDKLTSGTNVLAIHGLNLTAGDEDFLVSPTLKLRPSPASENPLLDVVFDDDPRVLVPTQSGELTFAGKDWNEPDFNDQSAPGWFDATYGVGFDTVGSSPVAPLIDPAGDIETEMFNVNPSAFMRSQFTVADPNALSEMRLNVDYDDGFVAFINGIEVGRANVPIGTPAFDATSATASGGTVEIVYDTTTQASGTNFSTHFGFGSSPGSYGNPAPYGAANNTNGSGWIWNIGGFLDVDFGSQQGISSFRAYSVYANGKRGARFVVEHSDDGIHFSSSDGGSFPFITTSGVGVNDEGSPEQAGNGYAGWYQFDFNPSETPHRYWRIRCDGILAGHAPRLGEVQFVASASASGGSEINFDITSHLGELQLGANVLAIQGINDGVDDSDFLIRPQLSTRLALVDPEKLTAGEAVINEVAAASDTSFFVEIANLGDLPLNLAGYLLEATGTAAAGYTFPSMLLPGNGFLSLTATQLGWDVQDGEKLFLYTPSQTQVADARVVTNRLRGRSSQHDGDWLFPETPTPGATNRFQFEDQIVINEIMYHHQPVYGTDGTPATFASTELLPLDNTNWRYNQTSGSAGGGLGNSWFTTAHPLPTANWAQGPAPLGFESSMLPVNIKTTLDDPQTNQPFIRTTYFETEFDFIGNLDDVVNLQLTHMIDDGAIFYLNGQEIVRYNMTGTVGSPVSANDFANFTSNASLVTSTPLAKDTLQVGSNRLAVEVHQTSDGSSDIVFAASLSALGQPILGTEGDPYHEVAEEWIELYNRGSTTVDLSQWTIREGVDFDFPTGTTIAPGDYLVVANNAAGLATDFPGVNVLGDFSRKLSNHSDTILLRDANKNPADEVTYFEGGRWPGFADGGGSSLELRDVDADNSIAAAWAPSNEAANSQWQTYTITKTASPDSATPIFNHFLVGFLDSGEVLIDDVRVIANPDGAQTQLIQNSNFENGLTSWRIHGTHEGSVVTDPTDPSNKVLRLVAYGPTDEDHNKAETTLLGNTTIQNGTEYQFTFRAKWVTGSRKLNTRLYLARVAQTFTLDAPENNGTPGMPNSTVESNIGPTYNAFQHAPVIPDPSEEVTVTVEAEDPDGVRWLTLYWRTSSSGSFTAVPMTAQDGLYTATIPGHSSSTVVQFYIEGRDLLGATSTFPAAGPDSRALYIVNDNQAGTGALRNFRFIMFTDEASRLFSGSNRFIAATAVDNETEVFYDVGAKLRGSPAGRTIGSRQNSYNISFPADQLFRGVQKTIILDTSAASGILGEGTSDEVLATHMMNHLGMHVSMYNDYVYMIVPNNVRNGRAILGLARYGNNFLQEQFGVNDNGTVYDFNKTNGGGYQDQDIEDLGDDKEKYRWNFRVTNQRNRDDFSGLIAMAKAFSLSGSALDVATGATMDMDSWLRTFAFNSLGGNLDVYTVLNTSNLRIYVRPDDNKGMAFPWDLDHFWRISTSSPLHGPQHNLPKIIDRPHNLRRYYGILLDMIDTTFNSTYMSPWAQSLGNLAGENYGAHVAYVSARAGYVTSQINSRAPQIPFAITSPDPLNVGNTSQATITGSGWVNVDQIRLASNGQALAATWSGGGSVANTWQVTVPVNGIQPVTLEAYDFQGQLIDSDTINITSSTSNPVVDSLRITEINYNPAAPTDTELGTFGTLNNDDFEFIELQNIGSTPIQLLGTQFTDGVEFAFPTVGLQPGERGLVVQDTDAFALRYGTGLNVLGQFSSGGLSNGGESITLVDSLGQTVLDFSYDDSDPWPTTADGTGHSLQRISITGSGDQSSSWTAAAPTPGSANSTLPGDFNGDSAVDDTDIDLLFAAIIAGGHDLHYDLDGSGSATMADVTLLVHALLVTNFGDTDLDQDIDTGDLTTAIINFTSAGGAGKTWSQGDTDGDGDVDTGDLTTAIINFSGARGTAGADLPPARLLVATAMAQPFDTDQNRPVSLSLINRALDFDQRSAPSAASQATSDRPTTTTAGPSLVRRSNRLHTVGPTGDSADLDDLFGKLGSG